jgi:hypothetical protein
VGADPVAGGFDLRVGVAQQAIGDRGSDEGIAPAIPDRCLGTSAPGRPLWAVWLVWLFAMILLNPRTPRFAEVKGRRRSGTAIAHVLAGHPELRSLVML